MSKYVEQFGVVQLVADADVADYLSRGWVLDPNPLGSADVPRPSLNDAGKSLKVNSAGSAFDLTVETLVRRDIPIAYNTPGLLTGHNLFTPQAGEFFVAAWVTLEQPWDGPIDNTTYVQLNLANAGAASPFYESVSTGIDVANGGVASAADSHGWLGIVVNADSTSTNYSGRSVAAAVPVQVTVTLRDPNTSDLIGDGTIGATQGAATIHFITAPPPA